MLVGRRPETGPVPPYKCDMNTPSPPTIWFGSPAAPPASAGPVTVQNGHLAVADKRVTFFGVNVDNWAILGMVTMHNGQPHLDPNCTALVAAQLDNLVNAGVRAVRIHGLDTFRGCNLFCCTNGPQTTTRQLDPVSLQALGWFFSASGQRNIRIVLTLHYMRQLLPSDVPAWTCPTFVECTTSSYLGYPAGCMHPWMWFDPGLMQLQAEFNQQLLRWVNPYTNLALGDDPTLMAVILQNEHSLAKDDPWSYTSHPVLNGLFDAAAAAWCQANNLSLNQFGALQHAQFCADTETAVLGAETANVRSLTHALVIAGTYYGDAPYSSVVAPAAVGDVVDFHFYSRSSPSDTNGFLFGLATATSARSRFAAVAAGCAWNGKPQICSEWGPVAQGLGNPPDPPAERSQVLAAVVKAAIAQDLDAVFLYSWLHSKVQGEGSPYWVPTVYDFRVDPVLTEGLPSQTAAFHDLTLRPVSTGSQQAASTSSTTVSLTPTNGKYGSMVHNAAGQMVYEQQGPFTDPALYAIPAGTKVEVVA
jgi:hypothetical protein